MQEVVAHPELSQSPLEIIRAAIRAAAVAPSDRAALDTCGDALRLLAAIATRSGRADA